MKKLCLTFLSKIGNYLLIFCGLSIVTWHCLVTIISYYTGTLTQQSINSRFRRGALQVLSLMRASYQLYFAAQFQLQPGKFYIFMSNHLSLFDLPLIFGTLPGSIRLVTKQQLFRIPLFGTAAKQVGLISIDREHPETMPSFFNTIQQKLKDGIFLWIFPEGTRSVSGELLAFKTGGFRLAQESGAHIIPVGIAGTDEILRAGSSHLHRGKSLSMSVGSPIDSSSFTTLEGQRELRQLVWEQIQTLCIQAKAKIAINT